VAQGKYKPAELLYQQALASISKTLDPDRENLILTLDNYASVLRKLNRRAEAAKLEARAKRVR